MHCPRSYTKTKHQKHNLSGLQCLCEHVDNYPAMTQLVQDHCSSYNNHLNLESRAVDTLHTFSLEPPQLEWRLSP